MATLPLQYVAINALTGKIICDLPTVVPGGPLKRTIGQYETQTVNVHVTPGISPRWLAGTQPGAAAIIAYRGDLGPNTIQWGGLVLSRKRSLGSNAVALSLATAEAYLDRRYNGAYTTDPGGTGATVGQNDIVSTLIANYVAANQGLPFTVVKTDGTGQAVFFQTNDYDDKTVYSVLGELAGMHGGIEYTVDWQWSSAARTITPVLYVGARLGNAATPGLRPHVTFDSSNLISADLTEDYSSGRGANEIVATSSGSGLARQQIRYPEPRLTDLEGRPRFEFRYSPSTSIYDPVTLGGHASHAWDLLHEGSNAVALRADAARGPQLGRDWQIGDDIGWELVGDAFPGGLSGVSRAIGYEADDQSTAPVLYVPAIT